MVRHAAAIAQVGREARDEETQEVREKFASKLTTLDERIRRKQETVARGEEQASAHRMTAAVSLCVGLGGAPARGRCGLPLRATARAGSPQTTLGCAERRARRRAYAAVALRP